MGRFRKAIRMALLAILAAAGLNGLVVFFCFDGANFYGHLDALRAREETEMCAGRVREWERKAGEARAEGNRDLQGMERSLRMEYAYLDSVVRGADLVPRHPLRRRELAARLRVDHPFRIENGKLAIYMGDECVYREMLPVYARMFPFGPGSHPRSLAALAALGAGSAAIPEFAFASARESGTMDIWQAYRRLDDSTYGYYCTYILDTKRKKLLQRGESMDRGPDR